MRVNEGVNGVIRVRGSCVMGVRGKGGIADITVGTMQE